MDLTVRQIFGKAEGRYRDQGHGANIDPGDFIKWIAEVTGYRKAR
ncbi:hypothetical protein [Streptomyces sp. NPDC101165]